MPGYFDHKPPVLGSERKDTDSPNVSKKMSGSIVKNLKKAERLHKNQMSQGQRRRGPP